MSSGSPLVTQFTHRMAVLKGLTSGLPDLMAESLFSPERLPEQMRTRLERSSDPIGRVLVERGARLEREPLSNPEQCRPNASQVLAQFASEVIWSRAYRLMVDNHAMFAAGSTRHRNGLIERLRW